MGERTGAELGLLTPTQRRELLVKIETRKPRTSKDAQMEEIAKLLAQLDAMEVEKVKEKAEMIFIEIMVLVFGLMIGFAIGRLW
jgi:ATP-dependent 26S proteasome regulatory subunit